jgi:hypothetical protein
MKNIVKPTYEFLLSQTTKLHVNECILDSFLLARKPYSIFYACNPQLKKNFNQQTEEYASKSWLGFQNSKRTPNILNWVKRPKLRLNIITRSKHTPFFAIPASQAPNGACACFNYLNVEDRNPLCTAQLLWLLVQRRRGGGEELQWMWCYGEHWHPHSSDSSLQWSTHASAWM